MDRFWTGSGQNVGRRYTNVVYKMQVGSMQVVDRRWTGGEHKMDTKCTEGEQEMGRRWTGY